MFPQYTYIYIFKGILTGDEDQFLVFRFSFQGSKANIVAALWSSTSNKE